MYSEKDQVDIAWRQYRTYKVDDDVNVNNHSIGTVKEVITYDTGRKEVQR